jgi:hypothetical protein
MLKWVKILENQEGIMRQNLNWGFVAKLTKA